MSSALIFILSKLWPLGIFFCIWPNITLVQASPGRVLIYSRTVGFRHDSIPTAIESLRSHSGTIDVIFDQTEDQMQFTDENLQQYDALLFLSTTGEGRRHICTLILFVQLLAVLDDTGKTALQSYLGKGGNFIAVHSASDCLRNTSFYGRELGEEALQLFGRPDKYQCTDRFLLRLPCRFAECSASFAKALCQIDNSN